MLPSLAYLQSLQQCVAMLSYCFVCQATDLTEVIFVFCCHPEPSPAAILSIPLDHSIPASNSKFPLKPWPCSGLLRICFSPWKRQPISLLFCPLTSVAACMTVFAVQHQRCSDKHCSKYDSCIPLSATISASDVTFTSRFVCLENLAGCSARCSAMTSARYPSFWNSFSGFLTLFVFDFSIPRIAH